jgi:excinuclease ABC subunit A
MDPAMVIPDDSLSIRNGAIPGWRRGPRRLIIYYNMLLRKLAESYNCPDMLTMPFRDIPEKLKHVLLFGSGEENLNLTIPSAAISCAGRSLLRGCLNLQRMTGPRDPSANG